MSNLKLQVKNFKGTFNLPYEVTYEIKDNSVSLSLWVILNNTKTILDVKCGLFSEDVVDGIRECLKRANEAWGLELTKANLKVA